MSDKFYYINKQLEQLPEKEKAVLQKKLDAIDFSVLKEIERRATVTERGVFAPLEAVEVDEIEKRADEFKEIGLKTLRDGKVGLVLLAGGQGTRLGFDQPKGTVNIGLTKEIYIFECLMNNLMQVV